MFKTLADMACGRIIAAITRASAGQGQIAVTLDAYNPVGSTAHVRFNTSRTHRWHTDPSRSHIN